MKNKIKEFESIVDNECEKEFNLLLNEYDKDYFNQYYLKIK